MMRQMKKAEVIKRLKALPYKPEDYWLMDETAKLMRGLVRGTGMIQLSCRKETGDRLLADGVRPLNEKAPAGYRQFRLDAEGLIMAVENEISEKCGLFQTFEWIDGFQVPTVYDLEEYDKLVMLSWGMDPDAMKVFCSEHYAFHYRSGSLAEKEIQTIAERKEADFRRICDALKVEPDFLIRYYLLDSPEDNLRITGDLCTIHMFDPDSVFAVYSELCKAVGPYGDAYIISRQIGAPATAVREGLAIWFEGGWNGADNLSWAIWLVHADKYIRLQDLLNDDLISEQTQVIAAPVMGAFTEWLIGAFGMDKYLEFFRYKDSAGAFRMVYGKSAGELNDLFVQYVRQFRFKPHGEEEMGRLYRRLVSGDC